MQLVSIADAAETLAVDRQTVRRLIDSGQLPAFRVRRSVRIRVADLEGVLRPISTGHRGEIG
jgi:excisionase family DNA binding protein